MGEEINELFRQEGESYLKSVRKIRIGLRKGKQQTQRKVKKVFEKPM